MTGRERTIAASLGLVFIAAAAVIVVRSPKATRGDQPTAEASASETTTPAPLMHWSHDKNIGTLGGDRLLFTDDEECGVVYPMEGVATRRESGPNGGTDYIPSGKPASYAVMKTNGPTAGFATEKAAKDYLWQLCEPTARQKAND